MLLLIGILISFTLIIFLIRKKFNFGLSLISGALILGIFALDKIKPIEIPKAMIEATFYSFEKETIVTETLELAVLMTLIYMLAKIMQETGAITKLIESLRTICSKGGIIGVIPAIYGLMPVPGGALFSAPSVKEEGDKYNLDKNKKNFFNIWFRHIWFPVYPISSSILIMSSLADISKWSLILANFVAFFSMIIIGFILLKFMVDHNNSKTEKDYNKSIKKEYSGLIYLLPPTVPLSFAILTLVGLTLISSFSVGVIFSIILLYFLSKNTPQEYIQLLKKSLTYNLVIVIFGIMIFREIFKVSGANVELFHLLENQPVPIIVILIVFPVILGLVTGYLIAAISLSFPLLLPFFELTNYNLIGFTSIIFMAAFVGYLISPIHLCNVLSSDYLKTDTTRMYKFFIPASILLLSIHIIFVTIFYTN